MNTNACIRNTHYDCILEICTSTCTYVTSNCCWWKAGVAMAMWRCSLGLIPQKCAAAVAAAHCCCSSVATESALLLLLLLGSSLFSCCCCWEKSTCCGACCNAIALHASLRRSRLLPQALPSLSLLSLQHAINRHVLQEESSPSLYLASS